MTQYIFIEICFAHDSLSFHFYLEHSVCWFDFRWISIFLINNSQYYCQLSKSYEIWWTILFLYHHYTINMNYTNARRCLHWWLADKVICCFAHVIVSIPLVLVTYYIQCCISYSNDEVVSESQCCRIHWHSVK